ncbi:glycosyltransferase [Candidatus Woesearchaeota archaeon]|nr:glycosyltransferase [Candidatus Woesearchaeota archaeon]
MKVLVISSSYPQTKKDYRGIYLHNFMKLYKKKGIDVEIVTSKSSNNKSKKNIILFQGIKVHTFRARDINFGKITFLNMVGWMDYFLKMLNTGRRVAKRFNPEIIHGCWAMPGGIIAVMLARRMKKKSIVTLLGSDMRIGRKIPILRIMIRNSLDKADYAVSDDNSEMFSYMDEIGCRTKKRIHIPNGANVDFFKPKKPSSDLIKKFKGRKILLMVAMLRGIRGHKFIFRCVKELRKRFPDVLLLLAGTGPEEEKLRAAVKGLGIENNVRFLGNINNVDLPDYYNLADAVLFASPVTNYSSTALFEAAACGSAVVATDVKDTDLVVMDGKTGLLAKYGDVKGYSDKIIKILSEKKLRDELKVNLRKLSVERFSAKSAAEKYFSLYKKIRR